VELRANVWLKDEKGECYGSRGMAFAVPGALWRDIFPGNAGFGAKAQDPADIVLPSSGSAPILGVPQARYGLVLRFESCLELGNELVQAGFHPTRDLGPTPVLQRGDGDSQFEFDSILGVEVTTAIAADDF